MVDWAGRTIGGYEIVEEIGRGSASVVCRAYQPQLERWVAVKILQTSASQDTEFLTRFRREAKAIAVLRHPNILTVHDYGEEGGTAYIVMEYVPGGSLKGRLSGEPLPWPRVADLLIPVGQALAYAHSEGIVHRDVKPANILLSRSDWPLLADFGLVKLLGRQQGITRPGVVVGTPDYFSPEQAAGDEVDHRSDIYSLGVVLYESLTGQIPFGSESPYDMLLQRLSQPPTPPQNLNPSIPPELNAVIMRALACEPEERCQSMDELVEALARLSRAGSAAPGAGRAREGRETIRLKEPSSTTLHRLLVMGAGVSISLPDQSEILIGRADPQVTPQPDVDLDPYGGGMAGVSRHHACLLRRPEGWLVKDLRSTNGTFLNNVRVLPEQPAQIHDGDVISCGQLKLKFLKDE